MACCLGVRVNLRQEDEGVRRLLPKPWRKSFLRKKRTKWRKQKMSYYKHKRHHRELSAPWGHRSVALNHGEMNLMLDLGLCRQWPFPDFL